MRWASLLLILCVIGCSKSGGSASTKPFLEQTKPGVLPKQSWTREIGSVKGGLIRFRVEAPGPYALILLTGPAFQTVQSGQKPSPDGVLHNSDQTGTYEGTVTVPAGSSWFLIENSSATPVDIKLTCWEAQ